MEFKSQSSNNFKIYENQLDSIIGFIKDYIKYLYLNYDCHKIFDMYKNELDIDDDTLNLLDEVLINNLPKENKIMHEIQKKHIQNKNKLF